MKIGRSISTAIAVHAALKSAVHKVGEAFLAKTSQEDQTISDAEIPDTIARDEEVDTAVSIHEEKTTGVHGVGESAVCSKTEAANIAAAAAKKIASGDYTGNETARQITVGFICRLVIIQTTDGVDGDEMGIAIPNMTIRTKTNHVGALPTFVTLHASDGFSISLDKQFNNTGSTYYYWAIEE